MAAKIAGKNDNFFKVDLDNLECMFNLFPEIKYKLMFILYRDCSFDSHYLRIDAKRIRQYANELQVSEQQIRMNITKLVQAEVISRIERGEYVLTFKAIRKGRDMVVPEVKMDDKEHLKQSKKDTNDDNLMGYGL